MTNRRNLRIALALAAIALVFALPRLVDASAPALPPDAARPLTVAVSTTRSAPSFTTRRAYTGRIEARRVAALAFDRTGLLDAVEVDEGARVKAGEPLARLDCRELDQQRAGAIAERDGAAARLAEMKAGPRSQTIEAARAVVRDLEAQEEIARRKMQRRSDLNGRNDNAIADEAVEEAEFFRNSVHARLLRARHLLGELVEGTRKEKIAAQEALVRRMDARVKSIEVALEKSTLEAPFAGTIAARYADEGAVLTPNQTLLELVESGALEARIGLPPEEAANLSPGTRVEVVVAGVRIAAQLRARRPQLDEATRTQLHIFQLADPPPGVVRGQVARLELAVEVKSEGFWVPTTALVRAPRGLWAAYVVEQGVVARREVSVLHAEGSRVFVRGTLRDGESLIRNGAHRVVVGQRVQVED